MYKPFNVCFLTITAILLAIGLWQLDSVPVAESCIDWLAQDTKIVAYSKVHDTIAHTFVLSDGRLIPNDAFPDEYKNVCVQSLHKHLAGKERGMGRTLQDKEVHHSLVYSTTKQLTPGSGIRCSESSSTRTAILLTSYGVGLCLEDLEDGGKFYYVSCEGGIITTYSFNGFSCSHFPPPSPPASLCYIKDWINNCSTVSQSISYASQAGVGLTLSPTMNINNAVASISFCYFDDKCVSRRNGIGLATVSTSYTLYYIDIPTLPLPFYASLDDNENICYVNKSTYSAYYIYTCLDDCSCSNSDICNPSAISSYYSPDGISLNESISLLC